MPHRHPVNVAVHERADFGERAADAIAKALGSWKVILIGNGLVLLWVLFNLFALIELHWDPYPFILLNLVFSWQAFNTGPVLLLAGNRQAQKDRLTLEHDYETTMAVLEELKKNTEMTQHGIELLEAKFGVLPKGV